MKLIVGLGNPGKVYEKTRHNIGFRVLDKIADGFKFEKKFNAEISKKGIEPAFAKASAGEEIILAKPQTFMNNSGITVAAIAKFNKIKPENIIVIHDDMDLAFGKIKLSFGSRSAGHNGVQSVIDAIVANEFYRIRIGIGPRPEKISADKFVLQKFSAAEEKEMKKIISGAIEMAKEIIS